VQDRNISLNINKKGSSLSDANQIVEDLYNSCHCDAKANSSLIILSFSCLKLLWKAEFFAFPLFSD